MATTTAPRAPSVKVSRALTRASQVVSMIRNARPEPVLVGTLVSEAGPYYTEVQHVLATLEFLGKITRVEEPDNDGGRTHVAYKWRGR